MCVCVSVCVCVGVCACMRACVQACGVLKEHDRKARLCENTFYLELASQADRGVTPIGSTSLTMV